MPSSIVDHAVGPQSSAVISRVQQVQRGYYRVPSPVGAGYTSFDPPGFDFLVQDDPIGFA